MKINWHRTHEFGDHDTVGQLQDGRYFWTWNLGSAIEPEELLKKGGDDGEDGGMIFDSLEGLIEEIEGGERFDLSALVKENF